MPTSLEYEFMASSLCPTAAPRALGVMLVDEFNRIWGPNGLGGHTLAADPDTRVDIANQTANVTLTAATTVDVVGVECLAITQTTASVTITLPSPTTTTLHRAIAVENVGSVAFTVAGADSFALNAGESRQWRWNGTNWKMIGTLTAAVAASVSALVSPPGNVANLLAPGLLSGVIYDAGNRAVQWTIDGVTYSASYSSAGITVAGTDGKITNISVDPALRITSVAPA